MATNVKQVTDAALKLLGHVNNRGMVDENREAKYYALAPAYVTELQADLLIAENYTGDAVPPLVSLTDSLTISDDTANRVLPSGLAMKFALLDSDSDKLNYYSQMYSNKLSTVVPADDAITDYYGALSDSDFQP